MFDIGFTELMLVAVMGLIILGPERLPKAARTVGLLVGKMRRTMSGIQQEIEQEMRNQELHEKMKDPMATFRDEVKNTEQKILDEEAEIASYYNEKAVDQAQASLDAKQQSESQTAQSGSSEPISEPTSKTGTEDKQS